MIVKTLQVKAENFGPLIYRTKDDVTHFYRYYCPMQRMGDEHHNLHLVLDEFHKDDVVIHVETGYVSKVLGFNIDAIKLESGQYWRKDCRKLIATTDDAIHEKYEIPLIHESIVMDYAYQDQYGGLEEVELVTENVYIEPEGIHTNRGYFTDVPKVNEDGEVMRVEKVAEFVDWNQFTISELIEHLKKEFAFSSTGTAKAILEVIRHHERMSEGLEWILNEYTTKVNESDEIVDKIKEITDNKQVS